MTEENPTITKTDPSFNVRELLDEAVKRQDDLREGQIDRIDERIDAADVKYQIQFTAAKEAVGIASTAQEKLVAQALDGTKEAINKADIATDKRFSLLSEKIDGVVETISKNTGATGLYVTHVDLSNEMSKLRADFEIMLRPVVTFMNSSTGQAKGISSSWATMATTIGITIAAVTLLLKFLP